MITRGGTGPANGEGFHDEAAPANHTGSAEKSRRPGEQAG